MIRSFIGFMLVGISCTCLTAAAQDATAPAATPAPASSAAAPATPSKSAVVVELFTSEGCSTCPPADKILGYIDAKQPFPGENVITLEEHVDYWNHDGWTDPFSSAKFTERQANYGEFFKKQNYTPQMVVDGKAEVLGSNGQEVIKVIQAEAQAPKAEVTIAPGTSSGKERQYTVTTGKIDGASSGDTAEVWLAVTENGLSNNVKAGENSGQTLAHTGTVRSLQKVGVADPSKPASFSGTAQVKFDAKWNPANSHVVVFVQEKKSRKILGASSIAVGS
jgi:hypothetical protein